MFRRTIQLPLPAGTRALAWVVSAIIAGMLLAACSGGETVVESPEWDARSVAESYAKLPFTPVIVNSNLGRGPTRLTLALLKRDQTLVLEGEVTARIFRLADDTEAHPAQAEFFGSFEMTARTIDTADAEGHATRLDRDDRGHALAEVALRAPLAAPGRAMLPTHDGALSTVFTTMVDFDRAGIWGAQLHVRTGSKTYANLLTTLAVLEKTGEPSVGDEVPRSHQKVATDVTDLTVIDSSATPNPELHDITIADAIASGKPSVVAFVTPAFCQTRFCGPVLQHVVIPTHRDYGDRVHVLHLEPFDLEAARQGTLTPTPTVQEWNLRSEPFIAVVDGQGRLAAKFEGIIDYSEIQQALDAILAR